jgi:hypothetical protein
VNIPRLRECLFIGCFLIFDCLSSSRSALPTGKHPHNCMFLIYPKKKNKGEKDSYIYIRKYDAVLYV